ncbi:brain-specific angiogenesis inhibitor 1-associated protein 2-like protein 1 [Erpetoichthys calabaricus]|uniref:brain-specific angiogenesis inhibitor 1-associated protein 2-like protein 1 n=1 Tax=Erpetoichthys calabaricus TaxID=27687 RepID=UPI0010A0799C|nr:brain-specific angiogenesis inhibitor 1-associated protein 2-like protein 1 [Erpetoichthys calabaricus]
MSRSEEVNKMTENVYKVILEQFNPSLKNFVTMGKQYEKALTGVTLAAKGYFDALVKLGELASDSQGSKELGDTLFQMAEVHRQIQVQLEDMLKLFHSELLSQLEHKLDLDIKYLTATLKKYQAERRSKSDSIERCQSELKKLRRKSQSSKHPQKYGDREMQIVELMSRHQGELDQLVAVGYRSALTEERRRYCFLVDRQCAVTKHFTNYHSKVKELLSQKLSAWQSSCSQPTKLPERALNLVRQTAASSGNSGIADVLRTSKLSTTSPLELGGPQRLSVQEVPPLPNGDASRHRGKDQTPNSEPTHNTTAPGSRSQTPLSHLATVTQSHGASNQASPPGDKKLSSSNNAPSAVIQTPPLIMQNVPVSNSSPLSRPQSPLQSHSTPLSRSHTPLASQLLLEEEDESSDLQPCPVLNISSPLSHNISPALRATDMFATSTLPLPRKQGNEARLNFLGGTMPRVGSWSPTQVLALFSHSGQGSGVSEATGDAPLLPFLPGDAITLLISEPRDGWHYGQNERTGRKGWFPFSYTQPIQNSPELPETGLSSLSKLSSGSVGNLDKIGSDGSNHCNQDLIEDRYTPPPRVSTFRPRPYSMVNPDISQLVIDFGSPSSSPSRRNPFAHVRLRRTITNDRSAPLIQ